MFTGNLYDVAVCFIQTCSSVCTFLCARTNNYLEHSGVVGFLRLLWVVQLFVFDFPSDDI